MAAKYDFKTSPDIQGEKEQPTLYPQIVVSGTKSLKDLAKTLPGVPPSTNGPSSVCYVTWKALSPITWQTVIT